MLSGFRSQLGSKGFLIVILTLLTLVVLFFTVIAAGLGFLVLEYGKDTPNYLYTVFTDRDRKMPADFTGIWKTWMLTGVFEEFEVKNGVRDGRYVCYYDTRGKLSEGFYKGGKEEGKWTYWFENGQKQREVSYKNGQEHGRIMELDDKGNLLSISWKYEGWPVSKEDFEQRTASEGPNR
jgi:hypothetical protein